MKIHIYNSKNLRTTDKKWLGELLLNGTLDIHWNDKCEGYIATWKMLIRSTELNLKNIRLNQINYHFCRKNIKYWKFHMVQPNSSVMDTGSKNIFWGPDLQGNTKRKIVEEMVVLRINFLISYFSFC